MNDNPRLHVVKAVNENNEVSSPSNPDEAEGAGSSESQHPRPPESGRQSYTTQSLLAVAVAEFNTRGYDATSMEDLSRAAGITKSSFYHHVKGKEDLLGMALKRALDGLFGILEEPQSNEGSPLERLRHILGRQVEVLTSELPYVTLLLRVRGNTEVERWALARRRAFDAAIAALVAEAVADGQIRADVAPALAARLLSGTVNSIIEWYDPTRVAHAHLPYDVVRTVFGGIVRTQP